MLRGCAGRVGVQRQGLHLVMLTDKSVRTSSYCSMQAFAPFLDNLNVELTARASLIQVHIRFSVGLNLQSALLTDLSTRNRHDK